MNNCEKPKEPVANFDNIETAIISDLRNAYKMIEKSRKSPEHRKVKHAVEQNMLLGNNTPKES